MEFELSNAFLTPVGRPPLLAVTGLSTSVPPSILCDDPVSTFLA
jgi:hypothetical protein